MNLTYPNKNVILEHEMDLRLYHNGIKKHIDLGYWEDAEVIFALNEVRQANAQST